MCDYPLLVVGGGECCCYVLVFVVCFCMFGCSLLVVLVDVCSLSLPVLLLCLFVVVCIGCSLLFVVVRV